MSDRLKACLTMRPVKPIQPWWERWREVTGQTVPKKLQVNHARRRVRNPGAALNPR